MLDFNGFTNAPIPEIKGEMAKPEVFPTDDPPITLEAFFHPSCKEVLSSSEILELPDEEILSLQDFFNRTSPENGSASSRKAANKDLWAEILRYCEQSIPINLPKEVEKVFKNNPLTSSLVDIAKTLAESGSFAVIHNELCFYDAPVWIRLSKEDAIRRVRSMVNQLSSEKIPLRPRHLSDLVELIKTDPALEIVSTRFVSREFLINCKDGVYHVLSDEIYPPSPNYGFFSYIDISAYAIGKGDGRYFEDFMQIAFNGDEACRALILEVIGILVANIQLKKFFLLFGESNSGKSQFGVFLQKLVGEDFAVSLSSIDDFKKNWTTGTLYEKRLCSCLDLPDTYLPKSVISVVKQIVGDDQIRAEKKFADPFSFYPEVILLFASNHRLKIPNVSSERAFVNRLAVIPFLNAVPESRQIPRLYEKLLQEAPYIIGEAAKALRSLYERNLVLSEAMPTWEALYFPELSATTDTASNIERFVSEKCCLEADAESSSAELYAAFQQYCQLSGLEPCNQIDFSRKLHELFPQLIPLKRVGTKGERGFRGVRI
ncbi:DNA primase family protein [Anaerotruncus colihominis]|uniref:DNA primase family protein n=1 Tax=Anaerotruncus colihominis TaxID=169435 RepID=UPI00174D3ABE|nr:phage/plasmid primase, P4 family [Anaerotruncus colihominis]